MGKYYSKTQASELRYSRKEAIDQIKEWDVFISHKTEDDGLADSVARCISSEGLTVFLDSEQLDPNQDGPEMGDVIKSCIGRSFSLMAILSDDTRESWWVPFEIGIAHSMEKFLATYLDFKNTIEAPSYLKKWPQIVSHIQLHNWCTEIKSRKSRYIPSLSNGVLKASFLTEEKYMNEMRSLTEKFT